MKVFKKSASILAAVGILFLTACVEEPSEVLGNKIKLGLRSQNNIDIIEWEDLTQYILVNKYEFSELMDADSISTQKLNEHILSISQQRRGQPEPEIFSPKSVIKNPSNSQVKVFIENSGSMDGYVRDIKDFEIVIGKLLVLCKDFCLQNAKSDFDVYFINKKVYPAPEIKELTDFARTLEPSKNSPYNKGDRSESILNDVIKSIIDSTSENSISILISDCIYSLKPTQNTKGSLGYQQNGTMEVFLNKFRNNPNLNLTTCIYKMISDYEGNYFPYDYDPRKKNSISLYNLQAKRPYYIWVIGESERVSNFNKKINFNSLKGFQNSYILSNFTKKKQPYYTVLKETNKVGSFKQTNRKEKDVKSINNVEFNGGTLQFSIAVDLGNIPVDYSYLTTAKNYVVPVGFTVKSVEKIDKNKLSQRDFVTVEKTTATHFITVSTTSKFTTQDLKLELSNKIPTWVEQSNSVDDRNVKDELDKTFGLSYLVQGVSEAYATQNPEQTSYFNITLTIKK